MPGNIINIDPAVIATWPKPNYVDPVERRWMPQYACTLYGVATVMVSLRLWLRVTNQAGRFGIDDGLLIVAWLAGSMYTVVTLFGTLSFDVGRHAWDVPPTKYEKVAEVMWLAELAFLVCGGSTKTSVLLFYRRLVDGLYTRRWKLALISAIGFTVAYTVAFILTLIFNCSPTNAYWKAFDPTYTRKYTCVDTTIINLLAGIAAAVSDLYAVILPSFMVSTFGIPRTQKIALYLIFSAGFLGVAASGVRTYYLYEVGHKSDVTWLIYDVLFWAHLELQLGLMCTSAPALRVFFRKINRAVQSSRSATSRPDNKDEDNLVVRRGESPVNQLERYNVARIRPDKDAHSISTVAEEEVDHSPSSSVNQCNIQTPADYEAYSLQNMEVYRHPVVKQSGQGVRKFSHPFVS